MMRNRLIIVFALAACAFAATAQNTDIEALAGLNFNFGNPGARALGMGGAFLGMADDSSAAEANPAGLTALVRPELTLELRYSETLQALAVNGKLDPAIPDSVTYKDFTAFSRAAEIAFASFVIPRGNLRIAGYFHSVLEFENEGNAIFEYDNKFDQTTYYDLRFYLGPNGYVNQADCVALGTDCAAYRLFPYYTAVNVDLETLGLAMAYKVSDNFSIGAAAKYQTFKESAATFRTTFDRKPLAIFSQAADDEDYAYSVGFKLGSPRSKFNVGGVYKTGGSFTAPVYFTAFNSKGEIIVNNLETSRPQVNVPDVYGLGVSYTPVPQLRINVDAVQVEYSSLVDDMQSIYDGLKDNPLYTREDVTEFHAGAEWYFVNSRIPWALRAGWWRDPEHALKWDGPVSNPDQGGAAILFPEGEDRDHYSLGIGVAFTKLQIDAAYDTSDKYKVGSISAKYVF